MGRFTAIAKDLVGMAFASILLIVLGLIYFLVTTWIVVVGVSIPLGARPSADFTAVAAALVTLGTLVGSRARGAFA